MQFEGKTVKEAVELGLKEMKLEESQAKITVVSEPIKGLFGKVKQNAVVEIVALKKSVKGEGIFNEQDSTEFVQKLLDILDLTAKAEYDSEKDTINIIAEKSSEIIGFRGELIDAIQTLACAKLNIGRKEYKKIAVDCENYREKREETLISLAHKLEEKATSFRRDVILEPMNPFERRIIHTALAESKTVTTKSEGNEPNRYVVIVPFDRDENAKPYNASRNNDKKGGFKKGGKKPNGNRNFKSKGSGKGFSEERKKTSLSFGTYLGNSLKDNK